jgi:hypothetical protein
MARRAGFAALALCMIMACGRRSPSHGIDAAGFGSDSAQADARVADGRAIDGTTPSHHDGPLDAAAATDCAGCQIVLFGGLDFNANVLSDTWIFNGSWTAKVTAEPGGLAEGAAASYGDHALFFGGEAPDQTISGALLVWRGTQWGSYEQGPSPRSGAAARSLGDNLVVFGDRAGGALWRRARAARQHARAVRRRGRLEHLSLRHVDVGRRDVDSTRRTRTDGAHERRDRDRERQRHPVRWLRFADDDIGRRNGAIRHLVVGRHGMDQRAGLGTVGAQRRVDGRIRAELTRLRVHSRAAW